MHCVDQQSGTGGKLLSDSQCDGECTSWSCGRNMEQGRRSQEKRLDKLQLWWKDHIFMRNQPTSLQNRELGIGRFVSQRLRNSSHQQDNRYKMEDAESRLLCREGSLSRSQTGKSAWLLREEHNCLWISNLEPPTPEETGQSPELSLLTLRNTKFLSTWMTTTRAGTGNQP